MQGMEGMGSMDMDMEGMHGMHAMRGMLGAYSMSREASGTAWQPESTPHMGVHSQWDGWDLMTHGFANLVFDHQSGDRGGEKTFSENMLMGMASRDLGDGRLGRIEARHALAGRVYLACQHGEAVCDLALIPGADPKIQVLKFDAV